jgi:hypothetical protein
MKSVAVHEEVPGEDAPVETGRALNKRHRNRNLAIERRAEETDPGQWWVPEDIGCRPQRDDPLCRSDTARTALHQEPRKDGGPGGGVGRIWNAMKR